MLGFDVAGRGGDARLIGQVEAQGPNGVAPGDKPLCGQILHRGAGTALVARADDNEYSGCGELAGDLQADPLVCAGDKRDARGFHELSFHWLRSRRSI